jgi:acyl-CoA hydrolase
MALTSPMREVSFCFLAQPTDVNFGGKVHGGMVMKWIDQVGYACAVGWSGKYCVTVAVGGIRFVQPIMIGDLVTVRGQLIYTGNTSMHFCVDVNARNLRTGNDVLATHCVIVMVATDDAGKPAPVPKWDPQSDDDKALAAYAQKLMELDKNIAQEISRYREAAHLPTPGLRPPLALSVPP